MHSYKIITDSTTDLPENMISELNIEVLPLQFIINNKSYYNYPDERDLTIKEFYKLLREGQSVNTVQVNVSQFLESFEKYLQNGEDILYIAFSSALSGTYNSATIAANELKEKYPNNKIIVIDSLSASMGEGLLVYHAVMQKRRGFSIEELSKWIEENKRNFCHWFTVNDLFHLKRGGRVSSASALFGSMLGIKPILHVSDDGKLVPVSKVRGRRQSIEELFNRMQKSCIVPEKQIIFISHGDCEDEAKGLKELIINRLHVKDVVINNVGPVIGAHSGPGTMALFFVGNVR